MRFLVCCNAARRLFALDKVTQRGNPPGVFRIDGFGPMSAIFVFFCKGAPGHVESHGGDGVLKHSLCAELSAGFSLRDPSFCDLREFTRNVGRYKDRADT